MSALAWAESHPYQIGGGVFAVGVVLFLALRPSKPATIIQQAPTGYNAAAVAANMQLQSMQIAGQVRANGYQAALKAAQDKNATQLAIADVVRSSNQDNIAAANALAITQTQAAIAIHNVDGSIAGIKANNQLAAYQMQTNAQANTENNQLAALQYQGQVQAQHDNTMAMVTNYAADNTYRIDMLQADVQKDKLANDHLNVIENKDVLIQQAMYQAQGETARAVAAASIDANRQQTQEYIAGQQSQAQIASSYYASHPGGASGGGGSSSGGSSDTQTIQEIASVAMIALMFL